MKIEYGSSPLNGFQVKETDENGKVTLMSVDGRNVKPTSRFWTSLCSGFSNYGLTTKLFKLFTHQEVFQRVSDVIGADGKDRLRFALETFDAGPPNLLAVTNPSKALVRYERMGEVLERYHAQGTEYKGGIIRSTHRSPGAVRETGPRTPQPTWTTSKSVATASATSTSWRPPSTASASPSSTSRCSARSAATA